jgi:DNA-binding NtrC family response regulator
MPRILVVDDQADVRAMIAMLLRVNHFEVIEAGNAASALLAFEHTTYDAVIVDIFLGDACGLDLISAMRERAPELAVVAVSGMATVDAVSRPSDLADLVCLQKPFRPAELLRAVSSARQAASSRMAASA